MAVFPIPAGYVDVGVGPGQLVGRDTNGQIPGVPIIYHRALSDEVAQVVAAQMASGWVRPVPLLGTLEVNPVVRNTVYLDAQNGALVSLNGYRLELPREMIAITLPNPPASGSRDDLIFLEAWFIRSDTGRALQYRFRVVSDVDFATYPMGLGDPDVKAFNEQGNPTTAVYVQHPAAFARGPLDPGLWWSLRTGLTNDPLSERGLDNLLYRFTWAVPIARVRRLNDDPYDAVSNPNGGPGYDENNPSTRPDGGWNDAIDRTYQLVDLRHTVGFSTPDQRIFRQALIDLLTHRLAANGVAEQAAVFLDDADYLTLRSDVAATDTIAIPVNLVKYSHFATDGDSDGRADGWAAYATGSGSGTRTMATPTGQRLARTGGAASDAWGVSASVTGVVAKTLTLQFGYTVNAAAVGATLSVLATDPTTNATVFLETITGLSALTPNEAQTLEMTYDLLNWTEGLNLAIYVAGANATVTLDYIDIRPDNRILPVMPVTDGSFYPVARPLSLAAHDVSFDAVTSSMRDAITGSTVAGTIAVVSNTLEFRPATPPTNADLRLVLGLNYAGADGFTDVLAFGLDRAQDIDGVVLPVRMSEGSHVFTAAQLGQPITTGEALAAFNPNSSNQGAVATIRLTGDGGGTYTIPATRYGRNVLWPLDCRIPTTSQVLSSVVRNSNGTITFTLGNGATVASGQYLYVDVMLDAPVLVWDPATNGVSKQAVGMLLSTELKAQSTSVVFAAPGVVLDVADSLVCSPVLVDGTGVSQAVALTTAVNGAMVSVTFPTPLAAGTIVQVLVLVRREFFPGSDLLVNYRVDRDASLNLSTSAPLLMLTEPVLLAHTKGTGGVDIDPDWGEAAFTREPSLENDFIALVGRTPVKTVLADIPLIKNKLNGMPLGAGRVVDLDDFATVGTKFESEPLSVAAPHETVLAALVSAGGRRLLLVAREVRADEKTSVTTAASVALYEPNGRPVAPGEI